MNNNNMYSIDKELLSISAQINNINKTINISKNSVNINSTSTRDYIEEKKVLMIKERLLLEIKLVEIYSKLSQDCILVMKNQIISNSLPLSSSSSKEQQQSLLSSLLTNSDAGKELVRKNTINYWSNNHSFEKTFTSSSSNESSILYNLSEIKSLTDRIQKEEMDNKSDHTISLLKEIVGISESNDLWSFEI